MCDPSKLALLTLGNAGLQAGAQVMQARYEQDALRQNQILAERGARNALISGAAEASEIRQRGESLAGSQKAAMAAMGVSASESRSAMSLLEDTAYLSELDAATATSNAAKTADALNLEAAEKSAARKNSRFAAPLAVGSTLLTGGSKAYGIYKKWDA